MTITFRHAETEPDLVACFPVMRELRPHLADAREFLSRVQRQFAEGYRLLAAWQDAQPLGLAGYRVQENLIRGRFCYVDDLVVAASARRGQIGARLLDAVGSEARALGITRLVLDTAIDNALGQRFYFRYGMLPTGLALRDAVGLRCDDANDPAPDLQPAWPSGAQSDDFGRAGGAAAGGISGGLRH